MTKIFKSDAIHSLGDWKFSMTNEDLSTLVFYDDNGSEIAQPSNFPTSSEIDTAQVNEQARVDNLPNVKASAKAKLIAGEALTEEEANTIVL